MTTIEWVPAAEIDRTLALLEDPYERCRAFSVLTRINTLYMIMRAGSGHLGSSFSAADIVTWLLLEEMREPLAPEGDVYFSSKGHDAPGLYAALIGLGMLDEELLHRLRRIDGLPGHPDVHTPHMVANTGSLGMGISKAKGMILANRLTGRQQRCYVLTGDGELQEGQNWEALAGAAHRRMGELTVIVDHNKIQSDTWVRDVNDLGDLTARFAAFGWGVLRVDGHDFTELEAAFRKREEAYPDQPVVIIADTVKGGGCDTFAATSMPPGEWRYRYHSGAPSPEDCRAAYAELIAAAEEIIQAYGLPSVRRRTVDVPQRQAPAGEQLPVIYGEALVEAARADERIVALDADLVLDTGLIPFKETFPERFIECGIAEQDMVSMASGLAAHGMTPFVHSFSCFLHARPNEQIYNNATEGRRVVYVGSLAGLLPAAPGHSHQAVRDVSALAAVPDLVVLEPANGDETRAAVRFCAHAAESVYLRLASIAVPAAVAELPTGPLTVGVGQVIRPGGPVVVIGAGPVVLAELLDAARSLSVSGVDVTVVNLPWLNRVDPVWLADLAGTASHLIVVENQFMRGGQADVVARTLLELAPSDPPRFHGIGLTEVPRCGAPAEVLEAHGLSAARLAGRIRAVVAGDTVPVPTHVVLRHP